MKEKNALRILYVLAGYIALQLIWWGYHIVQLNGTLFGLKAEASGVSNREEFRTKVWMVIGEGTVFFVLLALGFWYIKRTVSKQLELARMEQTFLLSVTHELKTPIAAVKLNLETMRSRRLSEEQSSQLIGQALTETKRLQSLTENILLATRLDQGSGTLLRHPINFSILVESEVARFRKIFNTEIKTDICPEVFVLGDDQMLSALVINLIDNAIKYSGDRIELTLSAVSHEALLEVCDFGQGVKSEDSRKIFEKFYRVGNEQSRTTKGTGLGLYIVQNVAKLHAGQVEVRANKPKGSIFVVSIPLNETNG
jgi:signal transduction histidine kinase